MAFLIKKANLHNVKAMHKILVACGKDMKNRFGFTHWDPPYPLEAMKKSLKELDIYAVYKNSKLIGTFSIGSHEPEYYKQIPHIWKRDLPNEKILYVKRLAVIPELQGQGIGSMCMNYIEHNAASKFFRTIRLDAYSKHSKLLQFYKKLNYTFCGIFTFVMEPSGKTEVACFEKMI